MVLRGFAFWKGRRDASGFLFAAALVSSPATTGYFAVDSGRLDQAGYLLAIPVAFLAGKLPGKARWPAVSLAGAVVVLLHEALLFSVLPLAGACALGASLFSVEDPSESRRQLAFCLLSFLPAAVLALVAAGAGRFEYSPGLFREKELILSEASDFEVHPSALMVHFRSLSDNLGFTLRVYADESGIRVGRLLNMFFAAAALLPSGAAAFLFLIRAAGRSRSGYLKAPVAVLCFAPVALGIIATDLPRWMASAVINLFTAAVFLELHARRVSGACPEGERPEPERGFFLLAWAVVFSLAAGPVTANTAPQSLFRIAGAASAVFRNAF